MRRRLVLRCLVRPAPIRRGPCCTTCPCAARACAPTTMKSTFWSMNSRNRSLKSGFIGTLRHPRRTFLGERPNGCQAGGHRYRQPFVVAWSLIAGTNHAFLYVAARLHGSILAQTGPQTVVRFSVFEGLSVHVARLITWDKDSVQCSRACRSSSYASRSTVIVFIATTYSHGEGSGCPQWNAIVPLLSVQIVPRLCGIRRNATNQTG